MHYCQKRLLEFFCCLFFRTYDYCHQDIFLIAYAVLSTPLPLGTAAEPPRAGLRLLTRNKAENRGLWLSKLSRGGEEVVPEGKPRSDSFHHSRVFLLPCSLKQPKPRHKKEASLTLSNKTVHIALSFKGLLTSWGALALLSTFFLCFLKNFGSVSVPYLFLFCKDTKQ